jgi:hypothetical protein
VEVISLLLSKYLHSNTLNYAQICKGGGSGDGGDIFRLYLVRIVMNRLKSEEKERDTR